MGISVPSAVVVSAIIVAMLPSPFAPKNGIKVTAAAAMARVISHVVRPILP